MAKRNKRFEPNPQKKPMQWDLPAIKRQIAGINSLYKNPEARLLALANLLSVACKNKAGDRALSYIKKAGASEEKRGISQLKLFQNKFRFLGNRIGTRLKEIDKGFWAAVEENNRSAATKSIMWAINFSERAKCKKYCSEYLEHIARRLLSEFVETETIEKNKKIVLSNLFCVSLKEAIKLAQSSGNKADLRRLSDLLFRGNSLFKSHGL